MTRCTRATALVAAALLAASSLTLLQSVRVTSDSMVPTLEPGDRLLLDPRSARPSVGDLVVFRQPGTDTLAVKRVVGTAGDTIGLEDGRLRRNGRLVDEPYVDRDGVEGAESVHFGPVHVPTGSSFVMGDNRGASVDSRTYGPIEHLRIVGRVIARVWPLRP